MTRPDTSKDTYSTTCVCGAAIQTQTREVTCAQCGRELVFLWGAEPEVFRDGRGHNQETIT